MASVEPRQPRVRRLASLLLLWAAACSDKAAPAPHEETTAGPISPADQDGDGTPDEFDCAPDDPSVHPGATEVCDEIDQDCDGIVDDNPVDGQPWFTDADGDGEGDPQEHYYACGPAEGRSDQPTDCDDTDPEIFAGSSEIPYDGIDQDCSGADLTDVDEDGLDAVEVGGSDCDDTDPSLPKDWFTDADLDTYGDDDAIVNSCGGEGLVLRGGDCDDAEPLANPATLESCDDIDNDCDGTVDEGFQFVYWFPDADGDGFGETGSPIYSCDKEISWVRSSSDCNDTDNAVHPGAAEIWYDGVDQDCSGGGDYDPEHHRGGGRC